MSRFAVAFCAFMLAAGMAAPASAGDPVNVERAILNASKTALAVRRLHPVKGVSATTLAMELGPRFAGNDRAYDVEIMIGRHAGEIAQLRSALNANPETRAALAARGIAVGRVVGAVVSQGWLRVYLK